MRFKDYTWPHNPEVYSVEARRQVAVQKVPFGQYVLQDLGTTYRVLEGQGVFAGEGAYDQFRQLEAVFREGGPGLLVHPVWQTANAWFVELSVKQEPLEDYVAYAFEFWECYDHYQRTLTTVSAPSSGNTEAAAAAGSAGQAYYTVVSGDTLYAIARKYALSLTELVALNPQIRNINLIYPGDRIRVQ